MPSRGNVLLDIYFDIILINKKCLLLCVCRNYKCLIKEMHLN